MLIKAQDSALVVIDMQNRPVSAMVAPDHTITNTYLLREVAEKIMVLSILTEQYPEGLGPLYPRSKTLPVSRLYYPSYAFHACRTLALRLDSHPSIGKRLF